MNQPANQNPNTGGSRRRPDTQSQYDEWKTIFLFYLLPFLAVNGILLMLVISKPHITIHIADTKNYKTTTASITIKSLLPIKEFSSAQEDTPLELTEQKKGQYTVELVRNGVIEIYAKGINGMTAVKYEHVNILDDVPPTVGEEYAINDGFLTLTLEDSQSGLDCQSVYGVTASGVSLLPSSFDKQTGTFIFPIAEDGLIVYASDLAGNSMQATFTAHMEISSPDSVSVMQNLQETEVQNSLPDEAVQTESSDDFLYAQNTQDIPTEETISAGSTEETASIYIHTKTP